MDDNKVEDENVVEVRSAESEVPPSSQISNPSTPPPPKIFEEDLKKNKRKKEKSDDKLLDIKRKRLGKGKELHLRNVE